MISPITRAGLSEAQLRPLQGRGLGNVPRTSAVHRCPIDLEPLAQPQKRSPLGLGDRAIRARPHADQQVSVLRYDVAQHSDQVASRNDVLGLLLKVDSERASHATAKFPLLLR